MEKEEGVILKEEIRTGDQVGVGRTMTGITCFIFLSRKAVKMSLVSKCDHFL